MGNAQTNTTAGRGRSHGAFWALFTVFAATDALLALAIVRVRSERTEFREAVDLRDFVVVRRLLSDRSWPSPNLSVLDPTRDLLCEAARMGDPELASLLLRRGARPDARDRYRETPLLALGVPRSAELALLLLEAGAVPNAKDWRGETPLHRAAQAGSLGTVVVLVDNGADVTPPSADGTTPLHYAARNGSAEIVRCLVEHGADVNARMNEACCSGFGIEPAVPFTYPRIDEDSIRRRGRTPLHEACLAESLECVQVLVAHGADVNAASHCEGTPLRTAVDRGHAGIVRFLVERGADVETPDPLGRTPLDIAYGPGHEGVPEVLAERIITPYVRERMDSNPLWPTLESERKSLDLLLRKHGR